MCISESHAPMLCCIRQMMYICASQCRGRPQVYYSVSSWLLPACCSLISSLEQYAFAPTIQAGPSMHSEMSSSKRKSWSIFLGPLVALYVMIRSGSTCSHYFRSHSLCLPHCIVTHVTSNKQTNKQHS